MLIIRTFISALLVLSVLSAQVRVLDLTQATPKLADWKIATTASGGFIGTSHVPAYIPVTLHLTGCSVKDVDFYFTLEIENKRQVEVQVPVSLSSKPLDRPGAIRLRELLIRLGTTAKTADPSSFKRETSVGEILLFGNTAVPGTVETLGPGERLVLRLRTERRSTDLDLSVLRVHIGGFDATLSPGEGGYRNIENWIPALWAMSEPGCAESKREGK